jgi:hypothetical protein
MGQFFHAFLRNRSSRIAIVLVLTFALLTAIQLIILQRLDYSTSQINWIDPDSLNATAPTPNFQIGEMYWDVDYYSKTPELDASRNFFNSTCAGLKGIPAASCLSEELVRRVPFGEPTREIFAPKFYPARSLASALAGRPGHCVTFSTLSVNSLLSVGIPARYVQLIPVEKSGHNIIEVWDNSEGWVAFDPLSDSIFSDGDKILSATEAHTTKSLQRQEADPNTPTAGHLTEYYVGENPFSGTVMYVEPWLHTRIGEKINLLARGTFVGFGQAHPTLWALQPSLRYGIIGTSLLFCLFAILLVGNALRILFRMAANSSVNKPLMPKLEHQ